MGISKRLRSLVRSVVAVATVGSLVLATAAPAQAQSYRTYWGQWGDGAALNHILLEIRELTNQSGTGATALSSLTLSTGVTIGANGINATNCKVTVYVELDDVHDNSGPWKSGKNTQSCYSSLQSRNDHIARIHFHTQTLAENVRSHGCIDLYYNASTSSGWQGCKVTPWHPLVSN